jgi:hypothetical protein
MAYSAVDTWNINSEFPFEVAVSRRGVRSPVDGGMVQRRQTQSSEGAGGQAAVRTFTLTYNLATKANYNRAVELWKKSNGGAEGLNLTVYTAYTGASETVIVRMVAAPFGLQKVSHAQYQFSVQMEEMLHAP